MLRIIYLIMLIFAYLNYIFNSQQMHKAKQTLLMLVSSNDREPLQLNQRSPQHYTKPLKGVNYDLQKFQQKYKDKNMDYRYSSRSCQNSLLPKEEIIHWLQLKFKQCQQQVYLFYSGHGRQNGDWIIQTTETPFGEEFTLEHLVQIWNSSQKQRQKKAHLYVFMDSCYSGAWCQRILQFDEQERQGISIFASCSNDKKAIDLNGGGLLFRCIFSKNEKQLQNQSVLIYHYKQSPNFTSRNNKINKLLPQHLNLLQKDIKNAKKIFSEQNQTDISSFQIERFLKSCPNMGRRKKIQINSENPENWQKEKQEQKIGLEGSVQEGGIELRPEVLADGEGEAEEQDENFDSEEQEEKEKEEEVPQQFRRQIEPYQQSDDSQQFNLQLSRNFQEQNNEIVQQENYNQKRQFSKTISSSTQLLIDQFQTPKISPRNQKKPPYNQKHLMQKKQPMIQRAIELTQQEKQRKFKEIIQKVYKIQKWQSIKTLKQIDIKSNNCGTLPESISQLQGLEYLNLKFNNIRRLPLKFKDLIHLKRLILSSNKLAYVPQCVFKLKSLQKLQISNNEISQLPEDINQLQNLKQLDISHNKIIKYPEQICLENLQVVNINLNKLEKIPSSICTIKKLNILKCYNPLLKLPINLSDLKRLRTLQIKITSSQTYQLLNLMLFSLPCLRQLCVQVSNKYITKKQKQEIKQNYAKKAIKIKIY